MKMSSISAQGVVERASAELSKRINVLGLRSSKHNNNSNNSNNHLNSNNTPNSNTTNSTTVIGKTSVMERVQNVLCGGNNNNNNTNSHNSTTTMSINQPEKPYRYQSKHQHNNLFNHHGKLTITSSGGGSGQNSLQSTPQALRKYHQKQSQSAAKRFMVLAPPILSIEQLFQDERFLQHFFLYFNSLERRELAMVCTKWRDLLYRNPMYFSGLLPVLQCRELRITNNQDKVKLYNSIIRRGFHSLCLMGATDEDALDLVHSFPLASKHIHSISLRCSSISDRGLESLLDHLQSLFELELAGCNEITEAGLWACLTPRIVSLALADCINVADEAVGAVAQLLPSLYEFSLQA